MGKRFCYITKLLCENFFLSAQHPLLVYLLHFWGGLALLVIYIYKEKILCVCLSVRGFISTVLQLLTRNLRRWLGEHLGHPVEGLVNPAAAVFLVSRPKNRSLDTESSLYLMTDPLRIKYKCLLILQH